MAKTNWDVHKQEILSLHEEGCSSSEIVQSLKEKYPEKDFPVSADRGIRSAVRRFKRNRFEEDLSEANFMPPENWSHGWMKSKGTSIFIKNPEQDTSINVEDIEEAIGKALKDFEPADIDIPQKTNKKALRGVISDAHVGMDSDVEDAVFGFEYGEGVFKEHLGIFFNSLVEKIRFHGSFDKIIVDDLGDGLDGLNAETTRGGHKLQQNMTDKSSWRAYVFGKLDTLRKVIELNAAKEYEFRNVANDNHSGTWGWTANMAIKMTLEQMYPNVKYYILNRPMEHFRYGNHTFILTHGKDKLLMKRGWPLNLTDKVANLIRQYIDHHNIRSPYIHLDKGDLHQVGFDREPKFGYRNFMSFAPPSAWIQSNYGVSYCGFSIQVIPHDTNEIQHTDIFFELNKV